MTSCEGCGHNRWTRGVCDACGRPHPNWSPENVSDAQKYRIGQWDQDWPFLQRKGYFMGTDVLFATHDELDDYEASLYPTARWQDMKISDAGYRNLLYKGRPVVAGALDYWQDSQVSGFSMPHTSGSSSSNGSTTSSSSSIGTS